MARLHFWNRSTGKDSQMRGYDGKLELVGMERQQPLSRFVRRQRNRALGFRRQGP